MSCCLDFGYFGCCRCLPRHGNASGQVSRWVGGNRIESLSIQHAVRMRENLEEVGVCCSSCRQYVDILNDTSRIIMHFCFHSRPQRPFLHFNVQAGASRSPLRKRHRPKCRTLPPVRPIRHGPGTVVVSAVRSIHCGQSMSCGGS